MKIKKGKLKKLQQRRNTSRKELLKLARTQNEAKKLRARKTKPGGRKKKQAEVAVKKRIVRKPSVFDHDVMKSVHEGLLEVATSFGEAVSPLAIFSIALTALQNNPHKSKVPYLYVILGACIRKVREAVVLSRLEALRGLICGTISETGDTLIVAKAFKAAQSVVMHCAPCPAIASFVRALEPSKLNTAAMPSYLLLVTKWLAHAAEDHAEFVMANISDWVELMASCFADAKESIAAAACKELISLFSKVAQPRLVTHYASQWNDVMAVLCQVFMAHSHEFWGYGADVVSSLFKKIEFIKRQCSPFGSSHMGSIEFTDVFPKGILLLRVMDKLRVAEDTALNPHVERAIIAIGRCMTVRSFLQILPFDPHSQLPRPLPDSASAAQRRARWVESDDAEANALISCDTVSGSRDDPWHRCYLTGCLAHIASHDSLPHCCEWLMPRLHDCRQRAQQHKANGEHVAASQWTALEQQYWRVVAEFCKFPKVVTVDSFKVIARAIVAELQNPLLMPCGCAAITSLCNGYATLANSAEREEDDLDDDDMLAMDCDDAKRDPCSYYQISREEARQVCTILAKFSINIMPKLCNAVEADSGCAILDAVAAYSKICSPDVMATILEGILKVGEELVPNNSEEEEEGGTHAAHAGEAKQRMVLDIATAIVGHLSIEQLQMIFASVVSPVLSSGSVNPVVQKKCFKILYIMFELRLKDILPMLPDILTLLAYSQSFITPSGVKMRLRCVSWALDAYKMYNPSMLPSLIQHAVAEIVLHAKHTSAAVRSTTMDLLEKMHRYNLAAGKPASELLHLVVAGLAGKSPMLVSCTVVCLAKLFWVAHGAYDRSEIDAITQMCVQLLAHVVSEIRAAAAMFCRMMMKLAKRNAPINELMAGILHDLLHAIALVTTQPMQSSSTRRLMKALLEKAIKRYGEAVVEAQFPAGSKRYFHYVAKALRRSTRLKQQEHEARHSKKPSDANDAFARMFISTKEQDEAFDLLGEDAAKFFVPAAQPMRGDAEDDDGADDNLSIASADGKLRIIPKATKTKEEADRRRQELGQHLAARERGALGPSLTAAGLSTAMMKRKRDDVVDYENEELIARFGQGTDALVRRFPSAITAQKNELKTQTREAKRRRIEEGVSSGEQFEAKRALGDTKPGNVDPYAYVPLDRRYLNRRYSRQGVARLQLVAQRALKGEKAKRELARRTIEKQ